MSQHRFSSVSSARQRLIRLMQRINFGRVERLLVRNLEPVFQPAPRVYRTIKLASPNGPREEAAAVDFTLRQEIVDLLDQLDLVVDGVIPLIDVRHGLPMLMEVEEAPAI